eukprot:SM000131S26722  [mRNA]  locus=s131:199717:203942:+ [translate_table: standard]
MAACAAPPAAASAALAEEAAALLRRRLVGVHGRCGVSGRVGEQARFLRPEAQANRMISSPEPSHTLRTTPPYFSVPEAAENPWYVVEVVLADLLSKYPNRVSVVRLHGVLHGDDRTAFKEIARQLCIDLSLLFSRASSFEDNEQFLQDILRECANGHRAVIFVLDEFDLFTQGRRQSLLYTILDALQYSYVQAAVVAISCRLDADQLLEKRVRSRFLHRKLLFLPLTMQDASLLLQEILTLPEPPAFSDNKYAVHFNDMLAELMAVPEMQRLLQAHTSVDLSVQHVIDLGFRAVCDLDHRKGYLTLDNFQAAMVSLCGQPKLLMLRDVSVLEMYLLVAMKRLEGRNRDAYNFSMIFAEYEQLSASKHSVADIFSRPVALRAFEHLLERELIAFVEGGASYWDLMEFRPVQLLVSHHEIAAILIKGPSKPPTALPSAPCSRQLDQRQWPITLGQWFSRESIQVAAQE